MGRKPKYDYTFKLQCVEAIINEHRSLNSILIEHGLRRSKLQLWLAFYEVYGSEGLKKQPYQQHYDAAFKLTVLTTIDKEHLSLIAACARFNISSDSLIVGWRQKYESEGFAGLINTTRGGPPGENMPPIKRKPRKSSKPLTREEELLLKIEALEAENELLKKLQALTQAKRKQKP